MVVFLATWLVAAVGSASAQVPIDVVGACREEARALHDDAPNESETSALVVRVEKRDDHFRAVIQGSFGARTVDGESCDAILKATLVFLALSAPPASLAAPPDEPTPDPEPTLPTAPAAPSELTTHRRPLRPSAELLATWGHGALPGQGFGAALRGRLGGPVWGVMGGVGGWLEREAPARFAGAGGRFSLWSGLLAVCAARPLGRVRPGACLGSELGRMHGDATGVPQKVHARVPYAAALLEVRLDIPLVRGISVTLAVQPQLSLVRPRFRLEGAGVVHQPARAPLQLALGFQYEISRAR